MQRLWAKVDQQAPSTEWPRRLAQGVALGGGALLLTTISRHLIGVDLPFAFALVAVALAAAWGGALTAVAVVVTAIPAAVMLNPDHPFVTPVNIVVVIVFSLILALFGGHTTALRKRADVEASRSRRREDYLQSIFGTTPAAMLIADAADNILAINTSARDIFGIGDEDVERLTLATLLPGWSDADVDPCCVQRADGKRLTLSVSSVALPSATDDLRTIYIRDETDRIAAAEALALLQAELHQLARATALGQLGSAIAHEVNQPLAAAANYAKIAQVAASRGPMTAEVGDALDSALQQIFRAADVLKGLRRFVQRGPLQAEWVDARQIITEGAKLGAFAVRQAGAELTVTIDDDIGEVFIDATQIQQVLLNLIANAADAVADSATRTITLRAFPGPEERCTITVSDTGPGLAAEIESALFTPFQTTKRNGLGVGLAISRTIVEAHDGRITGASNPGGGASFSFTLPRRSCREELAGAA